MDTDVIRHRLEREVVRAMDRAATTPMQWGVDDCGLWFANIIKAALGYDPGAQWRGRYDSREGAAVALGQLGLIFGGNMIAQRYGWRRIPACEALPGDVGFLRAKATPGVPSFVCVVVCRAPGWFVGRNESGFTAVTAKSVRCVSAVI